MAAFTPAGAHTIITSGRTVSKGDHHFQFQVNSSI